MTIGLIFILLMFVLFWGSVWNCYARLKKQSPDDYKKYVRTSFFSMGAPATLSLILEIICLVCDIDETYAIGFAIVSAIFFAFTGSKIARFVFKKVEEKEDKELKAKNRHNPPKNNQRKKKKKKGR